MFFVVNDLHGAPKLIDQTVKAIEAMTTGDTLIINGDGAGARGPIMNNVVKIFYEVRRGETDLSVLLDAIEDIIGEKPEIPQEWIYDSVHAGVFRKLVANRYRAFELCMREEMKNVLEETLQPLTEAAEKRGVLLVYLPGNGEIVPDDLDVSDITTEKTVDPDERFYQRLHCDGYFKERGVEYIGYASLSPSGRLVLSTHLLDLPEGRIDDFLKSFYGCGLITSVFVHYPPAVAPIGKAFEFWTPNKSDIQRTESLRKIIRKLKLPLNAKIFFGHIHLGANDPRMDRYPASMTFRTTEGYECVWVKPGCVMNA